MTNFVCEDHDFIAKRVAELKKEREDALKRDSSKPAEVTPVANTTDESWFYY